MTWEEWAEMLKLNEKLDKGEKLSDDDLRKAIKLLIEDLINRGQD